MARPERDPAARRRKVMERRVWSALTTIPDPATPRIDLMNMGMVYAWSTRCGSSRTSARAGCGS